MAYNPISGIVPQFSTANNELASGYYLKFYSESTTTPLSMSSSSTGGTLLAKCKLNPSGSPISNPADNTSVFIPHMNANYRAVLYKNEADADANTTGSAEWNVDGISYGGSTSSTTSDNISIRATTLQALDDYDRSPIFVNGTDFTAGAPPHAITVPAGWTPSAADSRFWKMSASGAISAAVISASTTSDFTVNESLLSTDTIFIGDDTNRNIHDGDPLDIRTRLDVYSTAEAIADGTGTVDATNLASDSVTTVKILDANVTAAKLATDSVETAKIKDLNVTAAKLAVGSVETAKILDDAVTTAKILDGNVTNAKLVAPTAGDTYQLFRFTNTIIPQGTSATTYDDALYGTDGVTGTYFSVTCPVSGVIRFQCDLEHITSTIYVRIIKNGSLVATKSRGGAWAAQTQDITVAAGDRVKCTLYVATSSGTWRNIRITSGTESLGIS